MSQSANESTVHISLTVKNAAEALEFYSKAFGAEELFRMAMPDGSVAHAEFMIGNAHLYISCESPEWHAFAMPEEVSAACLFAITTENADESFSRATEAGATPLNQPEDHFWGFRIGMVKDPYGYRWTLRQKIEDVSPEEMMKRAQECMSKCED